MPAAIPAETKASTSQTVGAIAVLRITLRPSRLLAIYLLSVHGLAALATWFSAVPTWGVMLVGFALILSLQRSLKRYWWQDKRELLYKGDSWTLISNGKRHDLQLTGESFVHPWLTIVRFKSADGRMTLPLPFDSASTDELRQLRRTLRFGLQSDSTDLSRR